MRLTVTIARILTGALFVFSGLVKAIDPRGLAYKMQEFFEAWAAAGFFKGLMASLNEYALSFSIIMITLEVAVGVALLLGWQKKITTWILLLLILFFTFLTSYVLFSGKIRACGCFGDCIPLTPVQTFTKDLILLVLCLLLVFGVKYIRPVAKPWINTIYLLLAIVITLWIQFYALKHLPLKDCLPYRKGNDILKLREMPADAVPDKYDYVFVYEKDGAKKDFTTNALPDSTWSFVERRQTLLAKGKNNVPLINDFSLTTAEGNDTTQALLSDPAQYYLLFLKELPSNTETWAIDLKNFAAGRSGKLYVVTAQRQAIDNFLRSHDIHADAVLVTDATAIKTAARANPTIFKMKGPVVQDKWSWADLDKVE